MKLVKTTLLILFVITVIHGQIDTTVWYPLEVGNYWEYKDEGGAVHYSREIIADTILTDGKEYFVFKQTDLLYDEQQFFYRRVEDDIKVYTSNFLLYDFSLSKDETWQVFPTDSIFHRRVADEGEMFYEMTNKTHRFKEFDDLYTNGEDTSYIERKWERVYKGIGEVIIGSWGGYVGLIKAKIGNKIYTQESLAEYYPLQVGNKWLYKTSTYDVGTTPTISYHTKEVVGDTLMDNGKKYFVIKESNFTYLERFDSTTNEIIRYNDWECGKIDNPIYNLNYIPKDTVEWGYCDSLGNPYQVYYSEDLGPDSSFIEFAKDDLIFKEVGFRKHLGLFYRSIYEVSYSTTILIGAEIDGNVWGTLTDINDEEKINYQFTLSQNYPNPFNPSTTIKFTIPFVETTRRVVSTKLVVYDILGREIKTLLNKKLSPGSYEVEFNGSDLPSGVYLYRLTNENYSATKKMLLLR